MKKLPLVLSATVALTVALLAPVADAGARQRQLPYGGLDRTFGTEGVASLPGSGANRDSRAYACLPGPNGEVFVTTTVGRFVRRGKRLSYVASRQQVEKLSASGRRVRGFGRSGRIGWRLNDDARPEELHTDSRGGLLLLSRTHGTSRPKYTLTRRSGGGRTDQAFGENGKVSLGTMKGTRNDYVTVLAGGRIAVASPLGSATRVALYSADGKPLADFGSGQPVMVAIPSAQIAGEMDGSIVVAGTRTTGTAADFRAMAVAIALRPDGKPSTAFGADGELVINSLPPSILQLEEQPTGSSNFVDHRLRSARVTDGGKLDLLVTSSRLEDEYPGYFWVHRVGPTGSADAAYGSSGDAYLTSEFGMVDPAQDEYEEAFAAPMSDGSWISITHSYYDFRDSYGLGHIAANGQSRVTHPFTHVSFPKASKLTKINPSADAKSIVFCGTTTAQAKSGGKRSFAWAARVANAP